MSSKKSDGSKRSLLIAGIGGVVFDASCLFFALGMVVSAIILGGRG